jgi:hypothetical protein
LKLRGGIAHERSMCTSCHCALRAPTAFSARMKSASAQKARLWIKAQEQRLVRKRELGLTQDRRLRTDVLFVRAQSAIRADGCRPRKLLHGS